MIYTKVHHGFVQIPCFPRRSCPIRSSWSPGRLCWETRPHRSLDGRILSEELLVPVLHSFWSPAGKHSHLPTLWPKGSPASLVPLTPHLPAKHSVSDQYMIGLWVVMHYSAWVEDATNSLNLWNVLLVLKAPTCMTHFVNCYYGWHLRSSSQIKLTGFGNWTRHCDLQ